MQSAPRAIDDPSEFEALYRAHAAYIWAVLDRLGVDAVSDAHQEVFITAYRRRDAFERGRPARPWLAGIARRIAFRHRRSQTRRSRKRRALGVASPQGIDGRIEARDFLDRFLATLEPRRREIFVRGELEGQTGKEIAAAMGLSQDLVYRQLRATRSRLRAELMTVDERPASSRQLGRGFALLLPRLETPTIASWLAALKSIPALGAAATTAGLGLAAVVALAPAVQPSAAVEPPRETVRAHAPEPAAAPKQQSPPTPEAPSVPPPAIEPPTPVPSPARTGSPRRAVTPSPTRSSVAEQTRRLSAARRAFAAGNAAEALAQLEDHARDYPQTELAELRGALRVEVLCALGRTAQARGEAAVLVRRYPRSNVARHAATVCPARQ